jgi:MFS family permease
MWTRRSVEPGSVDRHRRRLTAGVVTATVLMSSGAMVIFPLLPTLQAQLGISTADIGFMAAAGFAASLAAELIVAPYADRGRARSMGVVGVLLMAAALAGSALATETWHLVAGRALGGFGFGVFMAAASALLVRADPARAGESLGRLGAAELAGVSLGPLASGLAIAFAAPDAILAWSGAVVLLGVIPVALAFRERATATATARAMASATPGAMALKTADAAAAGATGVDAAAASVGPTARPPRVSFDLLRSPMVVGVLLLYGAVMVPTGAYDAIWPRFMADIGASEWLTALSYTLFAVPYALVAGWAGRLADRMGGVSAFVRGAVVLVPIVALYGVIGDPWIATGVGFVESSGQALAFIGAAAAMAQAVPAARAGASQGLMRAFGLLTAAIAAALSGVAYETGGPLALFGGTAIAVVLMIVAGLLVVRAARSSATSVPAHPLVHDDRGGRARVDRARRPVLRDLHHEVGGGEGRVAEAGPLLAEQQHAPLGELDVVDRP